MSMYEYEDDAASGLSGGLDVELGGLKPGPAPFDAVITRGRAIRRTRRRRRGTAAAALALVALASGLLLPASHGTSGPPPSAPPSKDWISVNSSAYDAAHGFVGSGTVRGEAWSMASAPAPGQRGVADDPVPTLSSTLVVGDGRLAQDSQTSFKSEDPMQEINWMSTEMPVLNEGEPTASTVYVGVALVPSDVGRIVAHYTNGSTVTYPSVEQGGRRYIAVLALGSPSIDRLTVYRADGAESGYDATFSVLYGNPAAWQWYAPDEKPPLAAGSLTLTGAMADAPGTGWTVHVYAGGFGICLVGSIRKAGWECTPTSGSGNPATQARKLSVSTQGDGDTADAAFFVAGPLDPSVTRLVETFAGGKQVDLPVRRLDGWGFSADAFARGGDLDVQLTAYDAAGQVVEHTSVYY